MICGTISLLIGICWSLQDIILTHFLFIRGICDWRDYDVSLKSNGPCVLILLFPIVFVSYFGNLFRAQSRSSLSAIRGRRDLRDYSFA